MRPFIVKVHNKMYINDLPDISDSFKPVLFAYDTNLIFSDKSITDLKSNIPCNLNKLFDWLNINEFKAGLSILWAPGKKNVWAPYELHNILNGPF